MLRFRNQISCFIFFGFIIQFCSANESFNIMKIVQGGGGQTHSALLRQNTKAQINSTNSEDFTNSFITYELPIVVKAFKKLNYSRCRQDALTVLEAITKRELWALKMFDASSKFPIGYLSGNFYQLGNFDECLNIKQPYTNAKEKQIQGQYCLADVEFSNKKLHDGRVARSFHGFKEKPRHIFNSTMYWSICVPSSCSVGETKMMINEIFTLATSKRSTVRLNKDNCYNQETHPLKPSEIIYGSFICLFCFFTISASIFHYYILKKQNDSRTTEFQNANILVEVILCFSLIKTVGKFLTTSTGSLNLECLSGIKFLSMVFIILGHTCLFLIGGPVQNTDYYEEQSRSFMNSIFINSPLLVDTFLLVSGFLMCYLLLHELDKKNGRVNFLILYIARYVRLTPSYLVVIGFFCTFFYRSSNGPLWSKIKLERDRCLNSWWTNILYFNNYVNTDTICMFQSWYLSADFHLFIIAPFIIYPLWKWTEVGKTLLGLGTFLSIIIPFIITWQQKLDPTLMIFAPEVTDITQNYYFKTAYIKTHMRAGSYFLGLVFGYLLYKMDIKGVKIPTFVNWFGWFLALICSVSSMASVVFFYYPDHTYNTVEASIYASLHRIAWSVSIGWVIIACVTKNASLINNFLSWKPFVVLSRLTYCAYLCNGFVELYSLGSLRQSVYMSKFNMATQATAHLIMTLALAFLLGVLFESPIHGLEKLLLRRKIPEQKRRVNDRNSDNAV